MIPQSLIYISTAIFILGFLLHTLKVANNAVTNKVFPSILLWVLNYWPMVLIRLGLATALFIVYATEPSLTDKLFGWLGFNAAYSLPVTRTTSFIFGFFADNVLDFIAKKVPWLAQELPSEQPSGSSAGLKSIAVLMLGLALLGTTGCTNFERESFQTLSASQAVINTAQTDYEARTIPKTTCAYTIINDAKAAQTAAVDAMVAYEGVKAAKGDLNAAQAVVVTDLEVLPADIAAVKTLYSNPVCEAK